MLLTLTYGVTILASSLLLFLVQPIMTKAILPWFGGSAGVWTSAILFFQAFLLLGYAYAHFATPPGLATCRAARRQPEPAANRRFPGVQTRRCLATHPAHRGGACGVRG